MPTDQEKYEETKPIFLKSHISGMLEAILLKLGMWTTDGEGYFHNKNCLSL